MHPQSIPEGEASSVDEKIVLGALILEDSNLDGDGKLLTRYRDVIDPAWFRDERNRAIYEIILRIRDGGGIASTVSIGSVLIDSKRPDWLYHLADISGSSGSPYVEFAWHIKRVIHRHIARLVEQECRNTVAACSAESDNLDERLTALRITLDRIDGITIDDRTERGSSARELALEFGERCQEWQDNPGSGFGWPTGITVLEELDLRVYPDGQFFIIAGEPNVGKSTIASFIAMHLAVYFRIKKLPHHVGVLSIEDGKNRFVNRAMAKLSGVPLSVMRKGAATPGQRNAIIEAQKLFSELPLFVESHPGMTSAQLPNAFESLVERGCSVILIDYLQLIGDSKKEDRQRVTEVSHMIKALALSNGVSSIAVSSLRKLDGRRPTMDDLKESGDIAFDATEIVAAQEIRRAEDASQPTVVRLDLLKQKDGAKGEGFINLHGPTFNISKSDFRPEEGSQPSAKDNWKADHARRRK